MTSAASPAKFKLAPPVAIECNVAFSAGWMSPPTASVDTELPDCHALLGSWCHSAGASVDPLGGLAGPESAAVSASAQFGFGEPSRALTAWFSLTAVSPALFWFDVPSQLVSVASWKMIECDAAFSGGWMSPLTSSADTQLPDCHALL